MGQLITDVIDIPDLIGYTREATNAEMDGLLARLLPTVTIPDFEYALRNVEVPGYEVARFRAWDTPPPLGTRAGFVEIKGEVLPIAWSRKLNEKEIVRFNLLRANLPGGTLDDIYNDALQTARAVAWRIQRARADLLNDGKVSITENGLVGLEADFGVPAAHIVTAAILWSSTATATPVANLMAWQSVYRGNNAGRNPAAWITSSDVIAELGLNAEIRNLAPITGIVPGVVTNETVGQVIRARGISPIVAFDGEGPNPTTGVMERLLSARKVIGVPAANLGSTLFGPHPMASNLMGRNILRQDQMPGVLTWVEEETSPASIQTISEAVAFPILRDPKALFVATV